MRFLALTAAATYVDAFRENINWANAAHLQAQA